MNKLDRLLKEKEEIEKKIAQLTDSTNIPNLPNHLLLSARKKYKSLREEKHELNIKGIIIDATFSWDGTISHYRQNSDFAYVYQYVIRRRKNDNGYNKLVNIIEQNLEYELDSKVISDLIEQSQKFKYYFNRVEKFVEQIKSYEEKYDFLVCELENLL